MNSRCSIVVGDITALEVDAVVNAANAQLARGDGVCGAIFRAAGPQLEAACAALAPCPTGEARITPGFNARARWIVHAVGPVWHGGGANEAREQAARVAIDAVERWCAQSQAPASIIFCCFSEDDARVYRGV